MIIFLAGAMLGGLLGFFGMAALAVAARADDIRSQRQPAPVGSSLHHSD